MNLSYQEIQGILKEVQKPEYSNPQILHIYKGRSSIFKYNKDNGLILIYGDEHVGLEHVISRHSLLSRKRDWKENGGLTHEATKFPIEISQRYYMSIAETIYKQENKITEGNSNKDQFDVYVGEACFAIKKALKYKLVVYKNTGIIHTLYPIIKRKERYNKFERLQLKQGFCKGDLDYETEILTASWSYINQDKVAIFEVIVSKFELSDIEYWHIQKNTEEGEPLHCRFPRTKKASKVLDIDSYLTYMNYHNQENIELIELEIKDMIVSG